MLGWGVLFRASVTCDMLSGNPALHCLHWRLSRFWLPESGRPGQRVEGCLVMAFLSPHSALQDPGKAGASPSVDWIQLLCPPKETEGRDPLAGDQSPNK